MGVGWGVETVTEVGFGEVRAGWGTPHAERMAWAGVGRGRMWVWRFGGLREAGSNGAGLV